MSRKWGYITFIAVVLIFLSLGCISASEVADTSSLSDSSGDFVVGTDSDSVSDSVNSPEDAIANLNDANEGDSSSNSVLANDAKNSTKIQGSDAKITTKSGDSYTVTLIDTVSNLPIPNQVITFKVNGKDYNRTTDSNGVASFKINLKAGKYPIYYSFAGNDFYNKSSGKSTISVEKMNTKITASNMVMVYSNKTKYVIRLLDAKKNPIANKRVLFKINGLLYKLVTNNNGYAHKVISLPVGTYKVQMRYSGDSYYTNSSRSKKITVKKLKTKFIAKDFRQNYGDGHYYTVQLSSILNNKLANKKVTFSICGKTFTKTTNSNGRASLKINLKVGTYPIKISFKGNSNYLSSSASKKIVVYKNSTKLIPQHSKKTYIKGEKFGVYLKDINNKPVADKKVKITFKGHTYTRTTNSKGLVSVPLNVTGTFTINYLYKNTTNPYMASTGSYKVKVIKNTTSLVATNRKLIDGATGYFKIRLLNVYGNPIPGEKITATLDGQKYDLITNDDGNVTIKFNLKTGSYKVNYQYQNSNPDLSSEGSKTITIYANKTYIYGNDADFTAGTSQTYYVSLKDQYKDPLANKVIKFVVDDKTYTAKTNSKGIAGIVLSLNAGSYPIKFSFEGDSVYPASSGSKKIIVSYNTFGVYVFAANMKSMDLKKISSYGIRNIFLSYYAFEYWGKDVVKKFISNAKDYGIRVHIWMQCFYEGSWINPSTCGNAYKQAKIDEAVIYAKFAGVGGIHLDYIRYPGTAYRYSDATSQITNFVKNLVTAVKAVNKNIIVSAALMPETNVNPYYYGQDSSQMGKYLDVLMPMAYKGNYHQTTSWLTTTARYFASHCGTAQVWLTLQAYYSDSDVRKLPAKQLKADSQASLDGGVQGVVFFRHEYVNYFNMSSLVIKSSAATNIVGVSVQNSPESFTLSDIITAASTVKSYYSANSKLPNNVKIGTKYVPIAEYLYYASLAIFNIYEGNHSTIDSINANILEPDNPDLGDSLSNTYFNINSYVDSARRTYSYILNNEQGPNYSTLLSTQSDVRVSFNSLIESFSTILDYYGINTELPSYIIMTTGSSSTISSIGPNTYSSSSFATTP